MTIIQPTPENIKLAVEIIRNHYYETSPAINALQQQLGETANPLKGKCYICSAVLQRIFGKDNIKLYRCEDKSIPAGKNNPQRYHWWCVTNDGDKYDITEEQYTIEGRLSPAVEEGVVIEERSELHYPSLKDKVYKLTSIVSEKLLESK